MSFRLISTLVQRVLKISRSCKGDYNFVASHTTIKVPSKELEQLINNKVSEKCEKELNKVQLTLVQRILNISRSCKGDYNFVTRHTTIKVPPNELEQIIYKQLSEKFEKELNKVHPTNNYNSLSENEIKSKDATKKQL